MPVRKSNWGVRDDGAMLWLVLSSHKLSHKRDVHHSNSLYLVANVGNGMNGFSKQCTTPGRHVHAQLGQEDERVGTDGCVKHPVNEQRASL